ncbi:hypothetical protein, partial [Ruegeria sp. HKCCSP351]|uniref:hypothetical protein n=1 Tax=Ruegeria sp. HKCCSP351 TaxID=2794832 RepID=UPI001AE681C0
MIDDPPARAEERARHLTASERHNAQLRDQERNPLNSICEVFWGRLPEADATGYIYWFSRFLRYFPYSFLPNL